MSRTFQLFIPVVARRGFSCQGKEPPGPRLCLVTLPLKELPPGPEIVSFLGLEGETQRSEGGVTNYLETGIPKDIRQGLNRYRIAKVTKL